VKNEQLETRYEEEQSVLGNMEPQIQEMRDSITQLEKELEEITNRKNLITRTEEQVKAELESLSREIAETTQQLSRVLDESKQLNQEKTDLQGAIAELKYRIESDEKLYLTHRERLNEYKSSHDVEETIRLLEEKVVTDKNEQWKLSRRIQVLRDELLLLEENRNLSERQSESLKFFRIQKIKAYPLRELIELDETAQLKDEKLFNSIKYTIFFQGKHVDAPNDLYHVPLMNIVPKRSIAAVHELHLKIKNGLKEEDLSHALKAIWWVSQFFTNGLSKIQNGLLIDPMGIRGSQEKERYILSQKALVARKQEVQGLLAKNEERHTEVNQQIFTDTIQVQELNRVNQLVNEAEAFMTTEYERKSRKKKLYVENTRLEELETKLTHFEGEKNRFYQLMAKQENQIEF
jgi:hypothetical protein